MKCILTSLFRWPKLLYHYRLTTFREKAQRRNFSDNDIEKWLQVLSSPVIRNDDVTEVLLDLDNSPYQIENLIREQLRKGANDYSTLVPSNINYYERLIGRHDSSRTIEEYCLNELQLFLNRENRKETGINEFLLSSHRAISKTISETRIESDEYQEVVYHALSTSHPILLISCLEVGLLKFTADLTPLVARLFQSLTSDQVIENLKLFCSMALFVDGELARLQLFKDKPIFYRRLASLTQSGLIVKVLLEENAQFDEIEQWAKQERGLYFYCRSLIDLRTDNRWLSDYLTADQFQNDLLGRLKILCQESEKTDVVEQLDTLIDSSNLLSLYSFLPGPLEGSVTPSFIPDDIKLMLDEDIHGTPSLETYKVLINSAPFWKIDANFIDRTISLLENVQHQLKGTNDTTSVYQILIGLSTVACMTRSTRLSSSVMLLSQIYRDYLKVDSEPNNYLSIGFVAAAAFEDKDEWAEFIGKWSLEIAYLPLTDESVSRLLNMLETLCILEPYLFYTCSKALTLLKMLQDTK